MSITSHAGGTTFTGESVNVYALIVLKGAIKLYRDTKILANRAYTPANMKRAAELHTNRTFKRGQWNEMIDALEQAIKEHSNV